VILFLRGLFLVTLVSMLAVTGWASAHCPLFAVPHGVSTHPWFIATLADAYWGFITFFVWVAYKQTSWSARGVWLVAILLLGNIAMSSYCLRELFRVPAQASLTDVVSTRRPGFDLLGCGLAVAGLAVVVVAGW
jgi:hypothetical protein